MLLSFVLTNCKVATVNKQETMMRKPLKIEKIEERETFSFNELKTIPIASVCDTGLKFEKLKKCVSKSIIMHINRKFNAGLAAELPPKKYTIIVNFVINKSGEIVNIESSGSGFTKLDNEATRAINLLPIFTPGMIDNKTVNTRYSLPISFNIQ